MSLTGSIVKSILNQNDPNPGKPRDGELFMSFLVVANLADLCETGRSILNEMTNKGLKTTGLPTNSTMGIVQGLLKNYYSDKMFIEDDDYPQRPNWKVIKAFPTDDARAAFQLYRIIRRNITECSNLDEIISTRDKTIFLKNFDSVFAGLPMKDMVSQFKNFLSCDLVPTKSQELVWNYFEELVGLIHEEENNIKLAESL